MVTDAIFLAVSILCAVRVGGVLQPPHADEHPLWRDTGRPPTIATSDPTGHVAGAGVSKCTGSVRVVCLFQPGWQAQATAHGVFT
jgi:hypothetical protein